MELKISDQTMTLKAENVSLRSILKQISATGILVKIDPGIHLIISADFKDKNIHKALDQILAGNSHALIWEKGKSGDPELSQIVIYRQGRMKDAETLITGPNIDIEEDDETGTIYVKNRILIQFGSNVNPEIIRKILKNWHADIKSFHKELGIYVITLPEGSDMTNALAALTQIPGVGMVEPDYAYKAPDPIIYETREPMSQNQKNDYTLGSSPVAVLDSGLNVGILEPDLNFASLDALDPETIISDSLGHGTQMALIASGQMDPMGIATETYLNPVISIRAFDDNGYTSNKILLEGIDFAIQQGAKVLSLSWGSETDSAFLKQAMLYARSKGLKIVAAAGNSPTGKPVYPAAYETVIAVAALAPDGKPWEQSNYGDFVDISAPGFAQLPVGHNGEQGIYAGTSIATAYVAGKLAASLRENSEAVD